uniref:At2g35280-like TPR domain-containing protein n=1 Tax=Lactuca sativa TaxID=4236 RepID=A0A9R1WP86_LACSA|nr:hypothetical protein LSAT_V11C100038840 [Lactuca sativa]
MATSCSSERMQTRQQGTKITPLPSYLIENIETTVGGTSPIDAFKSQLVKLNNPHVLFNDGMAKYFMIEEEIAGKQLLQDAADQGQLDAIFVMGMILMAEGVEKKKEALIMLNNVSCVKHPSVSSYETTFIYQYKWLLNCEICLWDACSVKFARMFDISFE